MSADLALTPGAAEATSATSTQHKATIRSAADVARLVNEGGAAVNNARMVVAIALGGVFLDAYDLTSLAYGVKDIAREFALSPAQVGLVR